MEDKYKQHLKTYNLVSSLEEEVSFFLVIVDAQRTYSYELRLLILEDWRCFIYAEEEIVSKKFVENIFAFGEIKVPPALKECLELWQINGDYAQSIPLENMVGLDYGALYYLNMKHKTNKQMFRYDFASSHRGFLNIPQSYRETFEVFIDNLYIWKKEIFEGIYAPEKRAQFISFEIESKRISYEEYISNLMKKDK